MKQTARVVLNSLETVYVANNLQWSGFAEQPHIRHVNFLQTSTWKFRRVRKFWRQAFYRARVLHTKLGNIYIKIRHVYACYLRENLLLCL